MGKDDKRNGAYIKFVGLGVKELISVLCGLRSETRTGYINRLIEEDIVRTYNAMPNRDAVIDAQQSVAGISPPLQELYAKLNERVSGMVATVSEEADEEEESY